MSLRPLVPVLIVAGNATGCASDACPKGSERRANNLCYLVDSAPGSEAAGAPDTAAPEDTGPDSVDAGPSDRSYAYGIERGTVINVYGK